MLLLFQWPEDEDTMRAKQIYLKTRAHTDYDWSTQKYCQFFSAGHLAKATKVYFFIAAFLNNYFNFHIYLSFRLSLPLTPPPSVCPKIPAVLSQTA